MKKRLFRIFILLMIIVSTVSFGGGFNILGKDNTVLAVGDLVVTWGVPVGDPIFVINNMAPGDIQTKTVNVQNNSTLERMVSTRGNKTNGVGNLEDVLDITISQGGVDLYGGSSPTGSKTLAQFFIESINPNFVDLSNLGSGSNSDYLIKITFSRSAGNNYQNTNVIFDLVIGIGSDIPEECLGINFNGPTIFGTSGNDRLSGSSKNELIISLEGNDRVNGGSGDDCIVTGEGNDRVDGGSGNDVILSGVGEDDLESGSGNDLIDGEEGNDSLKGGSGNDNLIGGADLDNLNGGSGRDSCSGEVENSCEI